MKNGQAYSRGEALYFYRWVEIGGSMIHAPFVKLDADVSDEMIGQTVRSVMRDEIPSAPWPKDWPSVQRPFLELVGVRSWDEFEVGMRGCRMLMHDETIVFQPEVNAAPMGGLRPGPDPPVMVPHQASDAQVGRALRDALARSK